MRLFGISKYFFKICYSTGNAGRLAAIVYKYVQCRKRLPNLIVPRNLSELILSSMLKKSFINYAYYADKIEVREYLKKKGLSENLLDFYGCWGSAEEIDFTKLPQKFALKANNGCGGHFICYDKNSISDYNALKQRMNNALILSKNFSLEPHYGKIKPRLFAEELIETPDHSLPYDYKFMCIKGQIADCLVISNRALGKGYHCSSYDENWNMRTNYLTDIPGHNIPVNKPKHWDEMKRIVGVISADFEIVRVDLYEYRDKVFVGELTFSPEGGFIRYYTDFAIEEMGKLYKR